MSQTLVAVRSASPLAFLGSVRRDFLGLLRQLHHRHGDAISFRVVHQRVYSVASPELADALLSQHATSLSKRTPGFEAMRDVLGLGLITSDGELWRRQRRTLQPSFRTERLDALQATIEGTAALCADQLATTAAGGEPVALAATLAEMALRVAAQVLLSLDVSADAGTVGRALTVLMGQAIERSTGGALPLWLPTAKNRAFLRARDAIDAIVTRVIADRQQGREQRDDVVQSLVEARDPETGEAMSARQVRDELMTLLLAGHETSSLALFWTLVLVERNPDVRARLARALRGQATAGERAEDLLRAALSESMRLLPPVWLLGRRCESAVDAGGFEVPRGALLLASPYLLHRRADVFPRPDDFVVDRWLPAAPKLPRGAYVPFGLGPRRCIGDHLAMRMMSAILAAIYRRHDVRLTGHEEVGLEAQVTLRPATPVTAIFERPR